MVLFQRCHYQAPGERMGTRFWSPQLVSVTVDVKVPVLVVKGALYQRAPNKYDESSAWFFYVSLLVFSPGLV